jgi:hypothetical protein
VLDIVGENEVILCYFWVVLLGIYIRYKVVIYFVKYVNNSWLKSAEDYI